jgi:hypothetical protein
MALPTLTSPDTITILRPVMVGDRGSQVPDWSQPPAETISVGGCSVQPQTGADDRSQRDSLSSVFVVYAPPGTIVGAFDRVLVDDYGSPLMTTGEPLRWSIGFLDHVVIDLVDWNG